jgi:hypothetical protein
MRIDGLPAVPDTAIPAGADKTAYRAALGFEQVLLGELVDDMVPESVLPEGPQADAGRDALAGSLVAAGGIGLGAQLYPLLKRETS